MPLRTRSAYAQFSGKVILERLTRRLLVLLSTTAIGIPLAVLIKEGWSGMTVTTVFFFIIMPIIFAGTCLAAIKLSPHNRAAFLLTVVFAISGIYAAEWVLANQRAEALENLAQTIERKYGQQFDRRSAARVVADMRASGKDVYPAYARKFLNTPLMVDNTPVIPFTGISRSTTVHCNESGRFRIYESDRYGFVNPDGLWDGPVDIAVIGDSFVHGSCVDRDIPSLLRERFPKTLNLGYGGFGPLAELGILTEYAALKKPKLILWFYYENDLQNLLIEMRTDFLLRYMQDGFSASLAEKQGAIDKAIKRYIATQFEIDLARHESGRNAMVDFALLRNLRQKFRLKAGGEMEPDRTVENWTSALPDFEKVLQIARERVRAWGGAIVFVYLPSTQQFVGKRGVTASQFHDKVIAIAKKIGLPVLDITPALATQDRPVDRFWYTPSTHMNPDGYAFVVETVVRFLEQEMIGRLPALTK